MERARYSTLVVPGCCSAFRERACLGVECRWRFRRTDVTLGFKVLLRQQIVGNGAEGRLSRGWGGEGLGAGAGGWVRSRRRFHHRKQLRWVVMLQFRARLRQIVINGAEGWLAQCWGGKGIYEFGKLDVDLFEFPDQLAQSAKAGIAVGR